MSMTREEAISVLAESKRQNEVMRDNPSTFWASHQMADGVKNAERRIAAIDIALSALRPVSRERSEEAWRGEWLHDPETGYEHCDKCSHTISLDDYLNRKPPLFCEMCGDAKTDEALEMVMERLEALDNETQ